MWTKETKRPTQWLVDALLYHLYGQWVSFFLSCFHLIILFYDKYSTFYSFKYVCMYSSFSHTGIMCFYGNLRTFLTTFLLVLLAMSKLTAKLTFATCTSTVGIPINFRFNLLCISCSCKGRTLQWETGVEEIFFINGLDLRSTSLTY